MQNYAAQDEILYHVGLSREMLKWRGICPFCPVTPRPCGKHLPNALGPAQYLNTHREYTSWLAVVEGAECSCLFYRELGRAFRRYRAGRNWLALGIKKLLSAWGTTGCIQEKYQSW